MDGFSRWLSVVRTAAAKAGPGLTFAACLKACPDTNRFSICTTTNFLKAVRDMTSSYADILQHIQAALDAAREVFARFTPGAVATEYKAGHDPVTEADRAV